MKKKHAYLITWFILITAGVFAIWQQYYLAGRFGMTGAYFLIILLIFRKWMA